jgi:hypothetical protein
MLPLLKLTTGKPGAGTTHGGTATLSAAALFRSNSNFMLPCSSAAL